MQPGHWAAYRVSGSKICWSIRPQLNLIFRYRMKFDLCWNLNGASDVTDFGIEAKARQTGAGRRAVRRCAAAACPRDLVCREGNAVQRDQWQGTAYAAPGVILGPAIR